MKLKIKGEQNYMLKIKIIDGGLFRLVWIKSIGGF